jgi:hypothetical protein
MTSTMAEDEDIDELYRGPLGGFTAARDALSKKAGGGGAAIKKLQKPTLPAWAVNQVFWHRRKVFDELATAVDRLRTAHARRLAGKDADLAEAERAHEAAVAAAAAEAAAVLRETGEAPSPATVSAITDTFRAYPWPEPERAGRLTRPLRPSGLEALAGLLPKGAADKPLATIVAFDRARREREKQRVSKREDQERLDTERRKELAAVERDLRSARAELRTAEAALAKRREALRAAETERDDLAERLEKATSRAQAVRDALGGETRRTALATAEVNRLEERLRDLTRQNR